MYMNMKRKQIERLSEKENTIKNVIRPHAGYNVDDIHINID